MARTKQTPQEKQLEMEKWKDDQLMENLEASMHRMEAIATRCYQLFSSAIPHVDTLSKVGKMAISSAEQHRKIVLTIHNIRHPKSTVFIKNQVNQLAIETEQLKKQIESSKNAKMDTSRERETETIDIRAQAVD
jgi:hypothetical protein